MFDRQLKQFFHCPCWEMVMHVATLLFVLYVVYLMFKKPSERTVTNLLLLGVIMTVMTLVHTQINLHPHSMMMNEGFSCGCKNCPLAKDGKCPCQSGKCNCQGQ